MWTDLIVRFFLGGVAVCLFALLGDLFRPKSFAGLFSAAPSIALGTLGLAMAKHGGTYTALEGQSMMGGAIALFVYCQVVSWVMMHYRLPSLMVASLALILWFGIAFGIWFFVLA